MEASRKYLQAYKKQKYVKDKNAKYASNLSRIDNMQGSAIISPHCLDTQMFENPSQVFSHLQLIVCHHHVGQSHCFASHKSQVFAFKSRVKSKVKTGKSRVKNKVLHFKL